MFIHIVINNMNKFPSYDLIISFFFILFFGPFKKKDVLKHVSIIQDCVQISSDKHICKGNHPFYHFFFQFCQNTLYKYD